MNLIPNNELYCRTCDQTGHLQRNCRRRNTENTEINKLISALRSIGTPNRPNFQPRNNFPIPQWIRNDWARRGHFEPNRNPNNFRNQNSFNNNLNRPNNNQNGNWNRNFDQNRNWNTNTQNRDWNSNNNYQNRNWNNNQNQYQPRNGNWNRNNNSSSGNSNDSNPNNRNSLNNPSPIDTRNALPNRQNPNTNPFNQRRPEERFRQNFYTHIPQTFEPSTSSHSGNTSTEN